YLLRCSVPVEMLESVKTHEAGHTSIRTRTSLVLGTGVRLDMFKREHVTFRFFGVRRGHTSS
ncbi:9951_t:CDS:2, partial [Racocetra persica]